MNLECLVVYSCALLTYFTNEGMSLNVSPSKSLVWGPGLSPVDIVMPARYFYIQSVDENNETLRESPGNIFTVVITGLSDKNRDCRLWVQSLDRKDGSFIVRYKVYQTCHNFIIVIKYKDTHVAGSPYQITGPVYAEECYCPVDTVNDWSNKFNCKKEYSQIKSDLEPYESFNFTSNYNEAVEMFTSNLGSMSVCNYVIRSNQVFRECFGKYVGFSMFMDAILLSITRKVHLPDLELFVNLGDWPLIKKSDKKKIPIFSWCGSDATLDIVMPTYDITEAALQCMGRVSLDMLSVQGNIDKTWDNKVEKAFWRGRDSRRERLQLIDIARSHPELFNASLTNFFFFREEEEIYGPKEAHVSFFKFFDYKYQINLDGTVAAYRFPYLLAGDSLVFKQDSNYYEYFYKDLEPWTHYVPFKDDLSDLVDRIRWAKDNDDIAKNISRKGQIFARDNLMPQDIFCYHTVLFEEWSKRVVSKVEVRESMEHVPQPAFECSCHRAQKAADMKNRDEL